MPEDCDGAEPPGLWLRRRRESVGLTQEELAELAGLSARTISNLESDRTGKPHSRSLRLVANALGIPDDANGELWCRFRLRNGEASPRRQPDAITTAVPRQLPSAVASFVGRSAELARLDQWLDRTRGDAGAAAVFGVGGMAGVGKTALALHWAHRVAGDFPDGQLYASFAEEGQAGRAADTADAIGGFLIALGVAPGWIPVTLPERSELFRSLVKGRQMLIVLDNAADAAQVRALVPGAADCVVVVTSRTQLTDLAVSDGAWLLNLDVLDRPEATQLLSVRLGADRVRDEPQSAQQLISLCGRLPLALVIAAARAAVSGWRLSVLVAQLADARQRLDLFDLGDSNADMRSVFSWSCRQLSAEAARMLRLLALHPGPDFAAPAAASLTGMASRLGLSSLRELTSASLITEHRPGRYELHDLLRLYAAEQARAAGSETETNAAVRRMLDHYLQTAAAAARLIDPTDDCPRPGPPIPGVTVDVVTSEDQALSWLTAEHKSLTAAIRQAAQARFDDYARQLAHATATFLDRSCHWHDLAATQYIALSCAERLDDVAGQALAHRILGRARQRLGEPELALAHLRSAVSLLEPGDDLTEQARAYLNFAGAYDTLGEFNHSLASARRASDLAEAAGQQLLLAVACNSVGYDYARLGDLELALEYCLRAIDLEGQSSHPRLRAATYDSLGLVYHQLGDFAQCFASYERALELFRGLGVRYHEAEALNHLGDAYQAAGLAEQAEQAWRQALVIFEELSHPDADLVSRKLPGAWTAPGRLRGHRGLST